jgi:hypothetical protein
MVLVAVRSNWPPLLLFDVGLDDIILRSKGRPGVDHIAAQPTIVDVPEGALVLCTLNEQMRSFFFRWVHMFCMYL